MRWKPFFSSEIPPTSPTLSHISFTYNPRNIKFKKILPSATTRRPENFQIKKITFLDGLIIWTNAIHIKKGFYRLLSLMLFCKCHEILDFVLHNLLSQRYIKKNHLNSNAIWKIHKITFFPQFWHSVQLRTFVSREEILVHKNT